jgi:hypothetical protein
MNAARPAQWALWPVLALGLLLGAALLRWYGKESSPRPSDLDGWDIPRLLQRLESRGLHLVPTPATKAGPIDQGVYLTARGQTEPAGINPAARWVELNRLPKDPEQIGLWRGTVYCEVLRPAGMRGQLLDQWGDCGLGVGPFVFFGDRALLRRIRAALIPDPPE